MIYRIARSLVKLFILIFNNWKIEGIENMPAAGPVVLVANHISLWDPPFLGCSVDRTVHYIAKEELFKIPVIGKIFPLLECFPVKRGRVDRNALRMAAQYLEKGEVLGIFSEGTRNKSRDDLLPFQPGAALFALRSSAPIVPVGLCGTGTAFPLSLRGNIRVRIGKPLVYPELNGTKISNDDIEKVTRDITEQVKDLLK